MADGAATPPTKGTTEQTAQPDATLWERLEAALGSGKVPDTHVQQLESLLIRALADQQDAARQKSKNLLKLLDIVLPSLPPSVETVVKDAALRVATTLATRKANANPPGVTAHQNKAEDADPVDLATGQLIYRHMDLSLDGASIRFEFVRTYRSQAHYPNGPLGAGWDYNLNLWLREVSAEVVVSNSGELREDRYTLTTPRSGAPDETPYYAPPEGFHTTLIANQATGSFDLTRPDGLSYQFERDPNGGSGLHRIKKIRDRFGNALVCNYRSDGITQILVNDQTRVVMLHRDDLGRIDAVGDYSGRVVRYTYYDYDDLIAGTLPATCLGGSTYGG